MPKKVAVIDGNSLMHRAYHAVPLTMNAPDGRPTNAVFGFLAMLLKFIDIASPHVLICAFDAGKPAFRIEELEQYKAQRPPMDEDLHEQFPIMEELLHAMNVPVVKVKGWEGDDILGTVAARDEGLGYQTLLVTGDKDAYQLATDNTHIVTTKKGITDVMIYGPNEVLDRYGVTPAQFPDFLGLMGDSSDNIPGVPGIGQKTAAKLLQAYGTMEGIYEHLDDLKGKQKENLRDHKDAAFLSRKVATIICDLNFPLDIASLHFPDFDVPTVEEAFEKYQLNSHLSRVLKLVGAAPSRQVESVEFEPLLRGAKAQAALDEAIANGETLGIATVEGASYEQMELFDTRVFTCVCSSSKGSALLEGDDAKRALATVVRHAKFAALDVKTLLHNIYPADTAEEALVTDADIATMRAFDLGVAGYVLNSSVTQYSLAALRDAYKGGTIPQVDDDYEQAAIYATVSRELVEPLSKAIENDGSHQPYFDIDLPLVGVLTEMERTGAALDGEKLAGLGAATGTELDEVRRCIYQKAGEEFNIDSPKQLARVLFGVMGLTPLKKNHRGYSTDASVLKELAKQNEVPELVLRYRELSKIKSTYIDALPKLVAKDGRLHTSFNETVTTTGRLSSSDPNLQNIPVRTDFGLQIRSCFIPLHPGEVFLGADYSQIELRLLAHLSGDEHLISAFNSGADFHSSTASHVFGIPVDQVTPELRRRAKAVNFGIVYGQQAYGLSQSLEIPFDEAREMIERYFQAYPGVRAYLDKTVADAKKSGYALTMFGRKRHIPELMARNAAQRGFGERTAMNHPMQGSAADIIKIAMTQVQQRIREGGFRAKLMLQVHDELDFSVPEDEVDRLSDMVREVMEGVVTLKVPLVVDIAYGANWAEAH